MKENGGRVNVFIFAFATVDRRCARFKDIVVTAGRKHCCERHAGHTECSMYVCALRAAHIESVNRGRERESFVSLHNRVSSQSTLNCQSGWGTSRGLCTRNQFTVRLAKEVALLTACKPAAAGSRVVKDDILIQNKTSSRSKKYFAHIINV